MFLKSASHLPLWFTLVALSVNALVAAPRSTRSDISVSKVLDIPGSGNPIRVVIDPLDESLYILKDNGDIYQVRSGSTSATRQYRTGDHGLEDPVGLAIGPDGSFYLVGYEDISSTETTGFVQKGTRAGLNSVTWSRLATSAPYGRSFSIFNHRFNGVVVSPDGEHIFVNSGSRTDHGEIQNSNNFFPAETREMGLTTIILKLPTDGNDIQLPNDREALRANGHLFAEGIRNAYDLAFAPNGDLFGTENSPDLDLPEELNWLREGRHYGFPWRIGGEDNPQRFPDYDPDNDHLLNPLYNAVQNGYYRNDPTFPTPPAVAFMEPVQNLGPDADKFRDAADGIVKDASDLGLPLGTFTSHRSPLGLSFDTVRILTPEFRGDGFVLSWTAGNLNSSSATGPFLDPSEDLLHLDLKKTGDENYVANVTRIVADFSNPIDSAMIGNVIYAIEYEGDESLWKITLPAETTPSSDLKVAAQPMDGSQLQLTIEGFTGNEIKVLSSVDLIDWFASKTLTPSATEKSEGKIETTLELNPEDKQQFFLISDR